MNGEQLVQQCQGRMLSGSFEQLSPEALRKRLRDSDEQFAEHYPDDAYIGYQPRKRLRQCATALGVQRGPDTDSLAENVMAFAKYRAAALGRRRLESWCDARAESAEAYELPELSRL